MENSSGTGEGTTRIAPGAANRLTDSLSVCETLSVIDDDVQQALAVLGLTQALDRETLEQKRRELLHTWHPGRYANLTNNPKKYMQMFKQAEDMTKKIESAYALLSTRLSSITDHQN